ncbi:MAG: ammonium transporter [Candidatus Anammoxibacter sp.]
MHIKNITNIFILFLVGSFAFVMLGTVDASVPGWTISSSRNVVGLRESINLAWVLLNAFLVFNMQAGFAFLGAGFLKKKNTLNYLAMSFVDFCIGSFVFWCFGFAVMFGGSHLSAGLDYGNALIGYSGFFLFGDGYDVSTAAIWLFQMMFAVTASTIVVGAIAERFKFHTHLIFSAVVCGVLYPVYGHWVWGGGWLADLPFGSGMKDFAGAGVVHGLGGLVALIAAWMVGPRFGKYNPDGSSNIFPGHNMSYVILGTLFLLFGWLGFNAGSSLAVTEFRVAIIAANTFLSAIAGALTSIFWSYFTTKKSDIIMACNSALAGCVSITASGAYVPHWAAILIGVIAAFILKSSLEFVENRLRVDDPVGAISVHGACGIWGLLSVGVFADGTYSGVEGLITGSAWQLLAQFIGCVTLVAWVVPVSYLVFLLLKKTVGLRVPIAVEKSGLDVYEHGISCYYDD